MKAAPGNVRYFLAHQPGFNGVYPTPQNFTAVGRKGWSKLEVSGVRLRPKSKTSCNFFREELRCHPQLLRRRGSIITKSDCRPMNHREHRWAELRIIRRCKWIFGRSLFSSPRFLSRTRTARTTISRESQLFSAAVRRITARLLRGQQSRLSQGRLPLFFSPPSWSRCFKGKGWCRIPSSVLNLS